MLVTKAAIDVLFTGFSTIYRSAYDSTPEYAQRFTSMLPSSTKLETYGWMTRILKMRRWDGPRLVQNLNTEVYQLRNETYENTVGMDVNDFNDDTLGVYNPIMQELGRTTRKWRDQQIKLAMQAGASTNSFDGVPFFSTTHPVDPAGNQSNLFTSTALTPENYSTVRESMMSYTGEDGEPFDVMPNLLVVPPQLEREARQILNADMIASDSGNAGVTNVLRGSAELLVVPELANEPGVWYLMDTSKGIRPFVFQTRQEPDIVPKNQPTDDNVFHDDQFLVGVKARGAAGYGIWWLAARAAA